MIMLSCIEACLAALACCRERHQDRRTYPRATITRRKSMPDPSLDTATASTDGLKVHDFRGLKALTQDQARTTDEALQRDAGARKDLERKRKQAEYRVIKHMEYATLYTGQKIPLVGLGTW